MSQSRYLLRISLGVMLITSQACYDASTSYPSAPSSTGSFTLAVGSAALTVRTGESVSAALTTRRTGNFTEPVALSLSKFPDGLGYTIGGASADTAVLTLMASAELEPGQYDVVIRGRAGVSTLRETALTLTVIAGVVRAPAVANVFAGGHACALTTPGTAYCWGENAFGQVGNNAINANGVAVPTTVDGGIQFENLSLSKTGSVSCGVSFELEAYCWGNNAQQQLGDGTAISHSAPGTVIGGIRFEHLAVGASHVCGLTVENAIACWGTSPNGAFGDGTTGARSIPRRIPTPIKFKNVVAGEDFTCALTELGVAYCWGQGRQGQLGDGDAVSSTVPVAVAGGLSFTSLVAAQFSVCGLTASGRAYCWGNNEFGTVGAGESGLEGGVSRHREPVAVVGDLRFEQLSAGYETMCGVTTAHAAYCWGYNVDGEVGDGSFTHRGAPTPVGGELAFLSIAAGTSTTCGVTVSRELACWGNNVHGALGTGSSIESPRPLPVAVQWSADTLRGVGAARATSISRGRATP